MNPLDRLALTNHDIEYAHRHWRSFHTALADRTPDGYPAVASGGQKGTGSTRTVPPHPDSPEPVSVDLTAVEAAVVARQRNTRLWREAEALTYQVAADAQLLRRMIAEVLNPLEPANVTRCNGGFGLEGGEQWGKPECVTHAITRDGLCDACRQRRDHWRRGAA